MHNKFAEFHRYALYQKSTELTKVLESAARIERAANQTLASLMTCTLPYGMVHTDIALITHSPAALALSRSLSNPC